MPEGQFTGSRSKYVYTNDTGGKYYLTLDDSLVLANSGLTVYDPTAPGGATPSPKRFKPRGVYYQATAAGFEGKRKFLVCGTVAATLYASSNSQAVTVDGVAGITTGRKGEQLSF